MWVKICANINLEDALLASELGADAVGFVFASSPRRVIPEQVAAITRHLPGNVETVGVFPAWTASQIIEAVEQAKLTTIQLHGVHDSELAHTLHTYFGGRRAIMQAVHWDVGAHGDQAERVARQIQELASTPFIERVLIDSKVGTVAGGTGTAFPWQVAKRLFTLHPKVVLAGGLNPNNIEEAITLLRPWGIDVASGVEAYPGKKDRRKLAAFIHAARRTAGAFAPG